MVLSRQSAYLRRSEYHDVSANSSQTSDNNENQHGVLQVSRRYLFLQFSPVAPMTMIEYIITSTGVEGIFYKSLE